MENQAFDQEVTGCLKTVLDIGYIMNQLSIQEEKWQTFCDTYSNGNMETLAMPTEAKEERPE